MPRDRASIPEDGASGEVRVLRWFRHELFADAQGSAQPAWGRTGAQGSAQPAWMWGWVSGLGSTGLGGVGFRDRRLHPVRALGPAGERGHGFVLEAAGEVVEDPGCTPSLTGTARFVGGEDLLVFDVWSSAATLRSVGTSPATMRSNSLTSPCPFGSGRLSTAV